MVNSEEQNRLYFEKISDLKLYYGLVYYGSVYYGLVYDISIHYTAYEILMCPTLIMTLLCRSHCRKKLFNVT